MEKHIKPLIAPSNDRLFEAVKDIANGMIDAATADAVNQHCGVTKKEYVGDNNDKDIEYIPPVSIPSRVSKEVYYLKIAEVVAKRGTCLRRKFGAVIVKDDRIVSTGYAGAPRGRKNCCDIGECLRVKYKIPSGERYELCRSVHAEMNAIISASPEEMKDADLYLVGIESDGSYTQNADCCSMCKRAIINAGIERVHIMGCSHTKRINVSEWIEHDDSLELHEGY